MANPFSVTIQNIVTDGSNIYVTLSVFNGLNTLPPMTASFPVGTTAAQINTYCQQVATNQPSLSASIAALVNTTLAGQ
jgi:hypothetical protein